jgi:hypothetical protein
MENKFNDATAQRPEGERVIDGALVAIDLPLFMEQIKEEAPWKESDRNAITVFKTNGLRIVLIALHKGAEMNRHTADGIISLQYWRAGCNFIWTGGRYNYAKAKCWPCMKEFRIAFWQ